MKLRDWTSTDYWAEACKYPVGSKERLLLRKVGDRQSCLEEADALSLTVGEEELLWSLDLERNRANGKAYDQGTA